MDDIRFSIYSPVVTGTPAVTGTQKPSGKVDPDAPSFQDVLAETISKNSGISFSKHAVKRAADHNLDLNEENLSRLNEGVKIASEKNLEEPLILVGSTAFLVNIPNNTVITAVDSSDMKGNVFTNIDGTVII